MSTPTKEIKGVECKFVVHIPSKGPDMDDVHMIKERVHYTDGTSEPRVKYVKNYQRPFWVTKKAKRDHQQKKEWTEVDNLLERSVSQSNLRNEVAKSLERNWSRDQLNVLAQSPYLYGTDISSSTFIKKAYQDANPELISAFSLATFDIETDVVYGTEEPILISVVYKKKIFLGVQKSFIAGLAMVQQAFDAAVRKYIQPYMDKYEFEIELVVCDDSVDLIRQAFKRVHAWKPDFLVIWNMNYDIPKIMETLEKYKIDPKTVFCDPAVPEAYRICKYKQGPSKKTTASGVVKPMTPAAQWHTLECTASFYVIDAMCAYKHIRLSQQEESSYSLKAILDKELKIGKLTFKEADDYDGLRWHQVMQTKFKIEYMVYNIFDSVALTELDDKTKDLAFTLPSFSAASDFASFKSQPKRITDALFFFAKQKGFILGTTGRQVDEVEEVADEDDDGDDFMLKNDTLDLKGWIVTLPAHMSVLGMNAIEEDGTMRTNIRGFVFDSDATAAYPTCTSVCNVSKETTKRELINIEGVDEDVFRMQNLNLVMGPVNAIEYTVAMFDFPKPQDLLKLLA